MTNELNKPTQPALPLPQEEYSRGFNDQLHNVFRLFFGQLTSSIGAVLSSEQGGKFIYKPHGSFYSSTTQSLTTNTDYTVSFEQDRLASAGITAENSNQRITVTADGVYRIKVEGLSAISSGSGELYIWLQKNGTDIPYTTRYYNHGSSSERELTFSFEVMESMVAGDYITVVANNSGSSPQLAAYSTNSGVPAAQIELLFVSNA